jgi:hypothetical protein
MRLNTISDRFKPQTLTKNINPNAVRFGVLTTLIGVTGIAVILSSLTSCKSTTKTKFDNSVSPEVSTKPLEATSAQIASTVSGSETLKKDSPEDLSLAAPQVTLPLSPEDPALDLERLGDPKSAAGPVVGLEVWQDDKPVTSILTGKQVLFKLSSETRDANASGGCPENPGIVQASWTIGSKPSADVQRYAGQDCRSLDYSGMFTKEGTITVRIDVLSVDGDVATAEKTFEVKNTIN